MELKDCPCGRNPETIGLYGWQPQQKWVIGYGSCCGEWMFEFRASYSKDEAEVLKLAEEAWNKLPRPTTQTLDPVAPG